MDPGHGKAIVEANTGAEGVGMGHGSLHLCLGLVSLETRLVVSFWRIVG